MSHLLKGRRKDDDTTTEWLHTGDPWATCGRPTSQCEPHLMSSVLGFFTKSDYGRRASR
jgi:hypothetical protein